MNTIRVLSAATVAAILLNACASAPPESPSAASQEQAAANSSPLQPASASPELWAAKQSKGGGEHVWSVPTEQELRKLEPKYLEATRGFVKLKKDDALMFCKRYRVIGSSIATIQCITEAQVRTQVDNMTQYRDDMRNKSGKCAHGVGCSAGF
jgi:hypothetical protein